MEVAKLNAHRQKNETTPFPHIAYKIQLKMDQKLNVKSETMMLLQGNTGGNMSGHWCR
jgi:hypothetical protein